MDSKMAHYTYKGIKEGKRIKVYKQINSIYNVGRKEGRDIEGRKGGRKKGRKGGEKERGCTKLEK